MELHCLYSKNFKGAFIGERRLISNSYIYGGRLLESGSLSAVKEFSESGFETYVIYTSFT